MLARVLPPGSRARTALATALCSAAALAFTRVGLPKASPNGVLLFGAVAGCLNALAAAGLILVYRSARVVNFAQVAMGGVGAAFTFDLGALVGLPFPVAFLAGLGASVVLGLAVELVIVRRFFTAPRLVLTVVTVVLAQVLAQGRAMVDALPFLPDRTPEVSQKVALGKLPLPFSRFSVEVFPFRFGFAEFLTFGATLAVFVGLWAFFRYSAVGIAVRGAAENADRALLLGVNVKLLSTVIWAGAAFLSGLAAILQGMTSTFNTAGQWNPEVLIPALAAAVLGRMRSLPVTVVTALVISVVQQAVFWSFPRTTVLDVVLLAVIAGGLILQRRRVQRAEEGLASSWEAAKEVRPTPRELLVVPSVRRARRALVALALAAVVVFPLASSPSQTNLGGLIAIQAIVALSLVVLTGWGGQVSLGQFAFVAVAAVVAGKLTSDWRVPFWVVLPVVSALTGGFAALVGLPALRLRGQFLAVTTLAFAVAVQRVLFNESYFGWLLPDRVERPSLFFLHFASERSYYYLSLGGTVVAALVVKRLRALRPGRVLIAVREDEVGIQAFGINPTRTKLAAFALSGALAGFAGVLFVHHQRAVDAGSYGSLVSVDMFIMTMIGGVTSVTGALLGATYVGLVNFIFTDPLLRTLTTGFGFLLLLFVAPGGLAQVFYGARDALLRIVATRHGILVPSLFEDYDPEALARRKLPLAPRIPGKGLEALPGRLRYRLPSELYGYGGGRPAGVAAGGGP